MINKDLTPKSIRNRRRQIVTDTIAGALLIALTLATFSLLIWSVVSPETLADAAKVFLAALGGTVALIVLCLFGAAAAEDDE